MSSVHLSPLRFTRHTIAQKGGICLREFPFRISSNSFSNILLYGRVGKYSPVTYAKRFSVTLPPIIAFPNSPVFLWGLTFFSFWLLLTPILRGVRIFYCYIFLLLPLLTFWTTGFVLPECFFSPLYVFSRAPVSFFPRSASRVSLARPTLAGAMTLGSLLDLPNSNDLSSFFF